MEPVEKIRALLAQSFPGAEVRLEQNDSIYGTITSDCFEGLETIGRVNLIWNVLDSGLSPEDRRRILMIVPATREEALALSA